MDNQTSEVQEDSSSASYPDDLFFKEKKHFPCFPTSVFEFQLENSELLNESFLKSVLEIPNPQKLPNWTSTPTLQDREEFKFLKERILESCKQVLGFGSFQYEKIRVTGLSSSVVNKPEKHTPGSSSNNFLSGIYCAKAGKGRIVFCDPRPQAWVIRPFTAQANLYNSDAFVMNLVEGKMVVFPSWLEYYFVFPEDMSENVYFAWNVMLSASSNPRTTE